MTCLCTNEDGTLASKCSGMCNQKEFIESNAVEQRSNELIMDKVENILAVFLKNLDGRIKEFEKMSMKSWKEGYKEGFREGEY